MPIKTKTAKRVLLDAKFALEKFKDEPIDYEFRHLVFLSMALLRTVGFAIESDNDGEDRIKANKYYETTIKKDILFDSFIKDYRDNLIHAYKAKIGWASITDINKNNSMSYELLEGSYIGRDIREMIQLAIEFWEFHLNAMENI